MKTRLLKLATWIALVNPATYLALALAALLITAGLVLATWP